MAFKLIVAPSMGFCSGVKKAVNRALEVANTQGGVETLGPLVHNYQVQNYLDEAGARVVDSVPAITSSSVLISAHGVGPEVFREIELRKIKIIDTTCGFVKRAQKAALELHESGFLVIVFGDPSHVEVRGILGWTENKGIATSSPDAILELKDMPKRVGIISQTTQSPARFAAFIASLAESDIFKDKEVKIVDTICQDTRKRQKEAIEMAGNCDLVFVIGGRHSANSRHLTALCQTVTEAVQIETESDIDPAILKGKKAIGITAGASTDDKTITPIFFFFFLLSAVYFCSLLPKLAL